MATRIIEKNTTLPTSASQVFSTAADNQTSVDIHVVQGERSMATDNKSLGRFVLDGIAPAQRGMPQIEVEFDLNTDGILNVTAKDKKTNKVQSIRIEARSGLSDEDINRMKSDAESHAEEDAKKKDLAEVRNIAEQAVYEGEAIARREGLSGEAKKEVEDALQKLRSGKETDDPGVLRQAVADASGVFAKHRGVNRKMLKIRPVRRGRPTPRRRRIKMLPDAFHERLLQNTRCGQKRIAGGDSAGVQKTRAPTPSG